MRKFLLIFCAAAMLVGLSRWSPIYAQTKVTFILNTSTVPDTIPVAGSSVQIRGGHAPITWNNDTVNNMVSIGGDYWSKTYSFPAGDTVLYKYVIAYASGTGWEQNVTAGDPGITGGNRSFIVPATDTTLMVEFWNNGADGRPQYFRPWNTPTPADSISIYFRVNMGGPIALGTYGFNNATDTVGVRGGSSKGTGELHWSPTFYLTKEAAASNGDGYTVPAGWFWSGTVRIPKDSVTPGQDIAYKFIIGFDWTNSTGDQRSEQLSDPPFTGGNRHFKIPSNLQDTTLHWVFFAEQRPTGRLNADTVITTYRVDMSKAISTGGFALGDTLYVRSGYFGTAKESGRRATMQRLAGTVYQATDTIITAIGKLLDYQYYLLKNGTELRENFYNFTFTGDVASEAERRQITIPGKTMTILDTATSITQMRRQPVFPNTRTLARKVLVKYEVNMKPAIYQLAHGDTIHGLQGTPDISPSDKDSVLIWGVWMNGPAVGGWGNPGTTDWGQGLVQNLDKKMWDDGTHGDATAHDSIYTILVQTSPDSISIGTKGQVGQVFKFGINGGDNEGGKGGFGNNHSENIVDSDTSYTIHSQFGSINPAFYSAWNYDCECPGTPSGVRDVKPLPKQFVLNQNYPNPFNPSTKIQYSLPVESSVSLKIFNLLGQEVATMVNSKQVAGDYTVTFDASRYPSGVYFYKITAGSFASTKKMLLMK